MSHQRGHSGSLSGPHALSLKVLRLSRPTLATQTPLPPTTFTNGIDIPPTASLAHASADATSSFPLTPLLTLPATFGAAYVGEVFACTLCANNELRTGDATQISGVKISAELQTPANQTNGVPLELVSADEDEEEEEEADDGDVPPGATLQRTLRHELKDEGPHVLAVTVTYYETRHGGDGGAASGGRTRTFRKLYQFVSQQLIAVRSKVTERKASGMGQRRQWVLEAQLENLGDASVVLENVALHLRDGISSQDNDRKEDDAIVLKPQDVEQVMFLLREDEEKTSLQDTGSRTPLAQMTIHWRSALGEPGSLKTGWLAGRGR